MRLVVAMLLVAGASAARAQNGQSQSGQIVADGATFGAVATLASLCGMRDEAWSSDLRHAALQSAADRNQLAAALGYDDMEALEDFAADKPDAVCAELRRNPALGRADAAVDTYRSRRDGRPVG